jgi:hypothetical protein
MDFQKRNITTPMFAIIVCLHKGTKQVDTNYNGPIMSKITMTFTEIVLTYLNFSIHRSVMYFFVWCSEVMFYTTAFATSVT